MAGVAAGGSSWEFTVKIVVVVLVVFFDNDAWLAKEAWGLEGGLGAREYRSEGLSSERRGQLGKCRGMGGYAGRVGQRRQRRQRIERR